MHTTDDVIEAIRAHGADAYPEEGCGFLLGTVDEAGNRVADVQRVANRQPENRERRYQITADDYRAAQKQAHDHGLDVVGFYHSHPDRSQFHQEEIRVRQE